jgi:hypothetical protein
MSLNGKAFAYWTSITNAIVWNRKYCQGDRLWHLQGCDYQRLLIEHLGILEVVGDLSLLKTITCVNEVSTQGSKNIIDLVVIISVWS